MGKVWADRLAVRMDTETDIVDLGRLVLSATPLTTRVCFASVEIVGKLPSLPPLHQNEVFAILSAGGN